MTIHLEGYSFGKLLVISKTDLRQQKSIVYLCKCKCGEEVTVSARDLLHGGTKGHPGCALTPANRPLYSIWNGIKQRCYNPNSQSYKDYGGRGIIMSNEWFYDYLIFESDMGPRPSPEHSVDRIDYNGNYCKENCRWATASIQATNQRPADYDYNKKLYALLSMDTIAEISKITGWSNKTICNLRSFSGPEKFATITYLGFQSLAEIKIARLRKLQEIKKLKESL